MKRLWRSLTSTSMTNIITTYGNNNSSKGYHGRAEGSAG